MKRSEAEALIAPHIEYVNQYKAVTHENARRLLGDERCERMLADRLRNLGPKPGTVYPWNVADYLQLTTIDKGGTEGLGA